MVQQVLLLVLSGMVADRGEFIRSAFIAIIAYWVLAFVIWFRRPLTPTNADIIVLKWGTLYVFLISLILVSC